MEERMEGMETERGNRKAADCRLDPRLTFYEDSHERNSTHDMGGTREPFSEPIPYGICQPSLKIPGSEVSGERQCSSTLCHPMHDA